jgi:hypothetical protein
MVVPGGPMQHTSSGPASQQPQRIAKTMHEISVWQRVRSQMPNTF